MVNQPPYISVIVPVYNGTHYLDRCLDAILASGYPNYELILVDDASTDGSGEIGRAKGATVIRQSRQGGPAAARNAGARCARGDILLFIDADVVVQPTTLERVAANFLQQPEIAAVFGSYDDSPMAPNFLSQYKNLCHHFVHQHASTDASTFWAGCGAVRRSVFFEVDGFNELRYAKPSIEDIELGYRLHTQGYRIRLDKELQVKHLKTWRFGSLFHADIFYRAVPWSRLILESSHLINDLNLKTTDRISAVLAGSAVLTLTLAPFKPWLLELCPLLLITLVLLSRPLYSFFFRHVGLKFALLAFPVQFLYYLTSGVTFGLCWCRHILAAKPANVKEIEKASAP
jgi:glycosyltransferase involved in cell wall biosynthesis